MYTLVKREKIVRKGGGEEEEEINKRRDFLSPPKEVFDSKTITIKGPGDTDLTATR